MFRIYHWYCDWCIYGAYFNYWRRNWLPLAESTWWYPKSVVHSPTATSIVTSSPNIGTSWYIVSVWNAKNAPNERYFDPKWNAIGATGKYLQSTGATIYRPTFGEQKRVAIWNVFLPTGLTWWNIVWLRNDISWTWKWRCGGGVKVAPNFF